MAPNRALMCYVDRWGALHIRSPSQLVPWRAWVAHIAKIRPGRSRFRVCFPFPSQTSLSPPLSGIPRTLRFLDSWLHSVASMRRLKPIVCSSIAKLER